MPDPKRSPAESLPLVPIVTVVVGLLAGSWLLFQPLTSSRPTAPLTEANKGMSIQDVDARLWQDPLQPLINAPQVAATATQESESAYDKRTHSIDELLKEFFNGENNKRLILAVMVNGSGYAEKVERRLRDRLAVESALERAGYFPNDAEHLGYFTVPWPRVAGGRCEPSEEQTDQGDQISTSWPRFAWNCFHEIENHTAALGDNHYNHNCTLLTVPFEEHQRDPIRRVERRQGQQPWDNILVLWLRQDFFDDKPLTRLAQLLKYFREADGNPFDIRVLGPDSSDSLLSIVDEVDKPDPVKEACKIGQKVTEVLNGVKMFAFRPSASDQILLRKKEAVPPGEVAALIEQGCPGLEFWRTTITDDVLLSTVVDELRRRNIRLPPGDSHSDIIALVSEQDTLFGRAYPETLISELCGDPDSGSARFWDCSKHFQRLSYLRGIDGRTPVRQNSSAYVSSGAVPSPTPGGNAYNTKRPRGASELPEGTDQSDYIRRLAKLVSSLDDVHWSLDDRLRSAGITAVGVLGSDVYDKLEILHALHSRLRPKVFFTTGLDARFYHPDELSATRNLVVVSAFGLRLHLYYQGSVPPFRDHNQTAAFAAALCALDIMDPSQFAKSTPRIFEISTNGPIDLSVDQDNKSDLEELREVMTSPDKEPSNIHPGRPDLRNW